MGAQAFPYYASEFFMLCNRLKESLCPSNVHLRQRSDITKIEPDPYFEKHQGIKGFQ
jgi:hypothetical protein